MTVSMIADTTSVFTFLCMQILWPEKLRVTDCTLSEVLLQRFYTMTSSSLKLNNLLRILHHLYPVVQSLLVLVALLQSLPPGL